MKKTLILLTALVVVCVGVTMVAKASVQSDVFSFKAPVAPNAKVVDRLEDTYSKIVQKHGIVNNKHHKINIWEVSYILSGEAKVPGIEDFQPILARISDANRKYHQVGDVAPLILVGQGGKEVIIGYQRENGSSLVVTYRLDPRTGTWTESVSEK